MTKKGWLRLSCAWGGMMIILTSTSLGIAYGIPGVQGSRNHLRTVANAKNDISWYQYDASFSFGSFPSRSFQATPHVPQLVRRAATGENVKMIDKSNPIDDDFNVNLVDSPHQFNEYFKLELAEKIIVTQSSEKIIFDDDDYLNPQANSINSPTFIEALNNENTTKIDFVIKKNIPWVDYQGNVVKNAHGQAYTIVPEDWVYGIYRTAMTSNNMRNSPLSSANPFGGFGPKPSHLDFASWTKQWWDLSTKLRAVSGYDFSTITSGYSNGYVYDLLNMQNPIDLVQISGNRPSILGHDDTISLQKKTDREKAQFYNAFNELIVRNQDFIPAPSQYIKDISSKINVVSGIALPDDPAINIRKYGIFTYGTSFQNTLYGGAYYVSENNSFRTKYEINSSYWDQKFVSSDQSVKSLTIDYFEVADQRIFAQSSLDQYNNERILTTDLSIQPPSKVSEIKKQGEKYGLRYEQKVLNTGFAADVFPLMLPAPNRENYYFNDNFARVWFGTSLANIKNGKMTISDYLKKWSIAARSQINASINWYAQNRTISENDNRETWYSYLSPDIPMNTADQENKTVYDYKKEVNEISYFQVIDDQLHRETITLQDNIDHYNQSQTQLESIKSAQFKQIQIALEKTLTAILGPDQTNKMEFGLVNRETTTLSANKQKAMEQYVSVFKDLNRRLEPQLKITLSLEAVKPYILNNVGIGQFHGWGPDYQGIGTWLTGMSRARFGIQATALGIAFSDDKSLTQAFPYLTEYGKILGTKINKKIGDYFNEMGQQEYKNLYKRPQDFPEITNDSNHDLSASSLISKTLLQGDKYNNLSPDHKLIIDQANLAFQKVIAAIDFELQNQKNDQWFIRIFNEQMSIMGKYFGTKEISIDTKMRFTEVMWQPWLIWSKLTNEIYYLQDMKVIQ